MSLLLPIMLVEARHRDTSDDLISNFSIGSGNVFGLNFGPGMTALAV
jgi:hypothetical protein